MRRVSARSMMAGGAALVSAGFTSLTALLVNVAAATTQTDDDFGHFSFVYVVVLTIMTLLRAVSGEVLLFTGTDESLRPARRSSTITVVSLAAIGVIGLLVIGVTLDEVGFAAAAALIPVCVQDNHRYLAFAVHRAGVAAISDIVTVIGPLVVLVSARGSDDAGVLAMLGWGGSALVGAALAELILRPGHGWSLRPSFGPALRQFRVAAFVEFLSTALLYQVPLLLLPAVVNFSDVGAMRGLQMVYSPVTIVHAALFALAVPRMTRGFEQRGQVSSGPVMVYLATLTALTIAIALVVSQIPSSWAEHALGDTTDAVQDDAWAYAAAQLAAAAAAAATIARRVERTYDSILRPRLTAAVVAPVLCLIGAASFGVAGACLALAASQLLYLALSPSPRFRARPSGAAA